MASLHAIVPLRRLEAADELVIPFWLQMEAQRHSIFLQGILGTKLDRNPAGTPFYNEKAPGMPADELNG